MPIDISINHNDHIVHATCHGEITLSDVQDYQQKVWGNGEVKGYQELFDASHCDVSGFSIADAMIVAEKDNEYDFGTGHTKKAIVISSEEHQQRAIIYTATRGLDSNNPRTIKTFYSESNAMDWIKK